MNALRFLRPATAPSHLTVRQLYVLLVVAERRAPVDYADIYRETGFDKTCVSRCLDKLGILGLAGRRRPDEKDRRKVFVHLTMDGRAFVESLAASGARQ